MTDCNLMKDFNFDSRDEFYRKPIAEKILKLLDSPIDVSPLIIDGKWGTGKTEFCFKLKNLIEADEQNNYKVGYINAFQADHTNEPLLTLIAEVASFYDEKSAERQDFVKNSIPYLRLVSGIGLKAVASLAIGKYASDIPIELSKGLEAIEEGTDSLIDQSLESMIKDQVKAEENLTTLRNALTHIASDNPVILLIDELDRCRPDFAIMMLETIKHVFDVENVQIVLVTNAEQLKATIKHSYGNDTDSHNYLYKFFKYQINLPTSSKDSEGNSFENNVIYFKTVLQSSNVIPQSFKDNQYIYDIPTFINVDTLSLRNIEQIVRCIETLVVFENRALSQSPTVEQILMVFLSFVYMMNKPLFLQLLEKRISENTFMSFLKLERIQFPEPTSNPTMKLLPNQVLLVIFNKFFINSQINFSLNHIQKMNQFNNLNYAFRSYDLDTGSISSFHANFNIKYIYSYIDNTINNLLLFDIVK